ncbi:hypothetical protein FOC1_g10004100 [Fusarium oxysporum f. sp. cubense race 1]|uniref:Uncharacterized protein n=1 Tax=Fusarium oxysporum f. sp. cubense (strain race 1) TaxID=1229664 RepID=N4UMT3_FUSC1|nr:hypothetical protein FOC1_g10004100 [Fusarium oxysporum f. sp. cubense race 1]
MASVRTEFHTHHAAPRRLLEELRDLLGPSAQFSVDVGWSATSCNMLTNMVSQMRHNIYEIETTEEFDVVSKL